jgi:hypothetical protein
MRVLYGQLEDAAEVARHGVQVGIDFDVYCGGLVDLAEVTGRREAARRTSRLDTARGRVGRRGAQGARGRE